jgi:alkyldihydroxyacetonephosphate synthase
MEQVQTRWNGWGMSGHDDPLAINEPVWRWLAQAFAMPALLATPPRDLSVIALPPSRLNQQAWHRLAALLGHVGQTSLERARHAAGRTLTDLLRLRAGDLSTAPDAVLYPRREADVLAVLKLCAEMGIAVVPWGGGTGDVTPARGRHHAVVALNLSEINRFKPPDRMSGLAEVEAGITGPSLERQLKAHGMSLGHRPEAFEFSTLGGWIAQPDTVRAAPDWLHAVRVATPQGMMASGGMLNALMTGSQGAYGVITGATIASRALPEKEEHRAYLFPDFASGLAAMHQAQRLGLPHIFLRLSDDGETRFDQALEKEGREWNLADHMFDVYLGVRRFDGGAARLIAGFSGAANEVGLERKYFDGLAKRLGALRLGVDTKWAGQRFGSGYRRDTLLDRGVSMDSLELSANWAKLPGLYVAVRAALKQAMRNHAPRPGARGLVLCHVGAARADGAVLTFSWLFPRILEDAVTQAQAIRQAALAAASMEESKELERDVAGGIKRVLDPDAILNPGRSQTFSGW